MDRIDKYTRGSQTSTNTLTTSNLNPPDGAVPQTPRSNQATHPGSPVASMHTNPSTTNLAEQGHFSALPPSANSPAFPAQQARLNPNTSAVDTHTGAMTMPASPTRTKDEGFERPRRSSSMVFNPGTGVAPQPTTAPTSSHVSQPFPQAGSYSQADEPLTLTRTTSSAGLTLDGIEPRIFPGVVSRRRRSSLRSSNVGESEGGQGYGQTQAQGLQPGHSGFVRGGGSEAVEEQDTDDE
jgi:AMP deaminase